MCMNTHAWWHMTGLRDCMNETMWVNAYIWPYFIYACVNMYIHSSMWLFSKTALIWTCAHTLICGHIQNFHGCGCAPCTYQHLTVLRNFICVYVNKWQHSNSIHVNVHMPAKVWLLLETAWMWTYMYTKIYDFMWKWLVCEDVHTCWHLIVLKDCRNANVCMHCLVTMLRSCMHIITYTKLTIW